MARGSLEVTGFKTHSIFGMNRDKVLLLPLFTKSHRAFLILLSFLSFTILRPHPGSVESLELSVFPSETNVAGLDEHPFPLPWKTAAISSCSPRGEAKPLMNEPRNSESGTSSPTVRCLPKRLAPF